MAFNHLLILLISSFIIHQTNSLKCFSCSTLAGARQCTHDNFEESSNAKLDCPEGSNICTTLTVISGKSDGSVLRSCGIASASINETICGGGYFSPSGSCLTYKCTEGSFAGSDVQVCSCKNNLSNDKNIEDC